jgi:hypothetical protein
MIEGFKESIPLRRERVPGKSLEVTGRVKTITGSGAIDLAMDQTGRFQYLPVPADRGLR